MFTVSPTPLPDADPRVWTVGPITRRQVAGFIAELYLVTPNAAFRPVVEAHIAPGYLSATLYIRNRRASAMVMLALVEAGALPIGDDFPTRPAHGYLPSMALIQEWATAPTRNGQILLLHREAAA